MAPKAKAKISKKKTEEKVKKKPKVEEPRVEKKPKPTTIKLKIFGRWSTDIEVLDPGLKSYINLRPVYVPYTAGRTIKKQFWKSKKSIVERLIGKLMVAGHKGKKHYWTSGVNTGKISTQYKIVQKTFELIEGRTKKNPIEVLVRALEVGTAREGFAHIEYGGVRYPKAADLAPQRRIDLALRWIVQGAFEKSRKGKKSIQQALANEIIATMNNDTSKSNCITKKIELERQAAAAR